MDERIKCLISNDILCTSDESKSLEKIQWISAIYVQRDL